ncbi:MAG: TMEM43 family protein [Candidatus Dojkabacteria bacterium]
MENHVTTVVTKTNFVKRILNSIAGIFFGFLIFIGSFFLLFWNEGRPNQLDTYKQASEVNSNDLANVQDGEFIAVRGTLTSSDESQLGDPLLLKPGNYLVLERRVEMYSWIEESKSETKSLPGGSEETVTTYTYKQDWTSNPQDSSRFHDTTKHFNPEPGVEKETFINDSVTLGDHSVDLQNATLPGLNKLNLNQDMLLKQPGAPREAIPGSTLTNVQVQNNYVFSGVGDLLNPQVGDYRITYYVLPQNTEVLLFAQKENNKLAAYTDKNGVQAYRVFTGSYNEALRQIGTEDKLLRWGLRAAGFILMWSGLMAMLGLLTVLADVIPFIGRLTKTILGFITFLIALILTTLTVIISIILHSTIAMIIIGTLLAITLVVVLYLIIQSKHRNKPGTVTST